MIDSLFNSADSIARNKVNAETVLKLTEKLIPAVYEAVEKHSDTLKKIRVLSSLTQRQLADIAGVAQPRIHAIEYGVLHGMSLETLVRILKAYKELEDGLNRSA